MISQFHRVYQKFSIRFENQIRLHTRRNGEYNEKRRETKGTNDSRGDSFPSGSSTHDKEFYTYLLVVCRNSNES